MNEYLVICNRRGDPISDVKTSEFKADFKARLAKPNAWNTDIRGLEFNTLIIDTLAYNPNLAQAVGRRNIKEAVKRARKYKKKFKDSIVIKQEMHEQIDMLRYALPPKGTVFQRNKKGK